MEPRQLFVEAARSKVGAPYRWGAKGPDLFDCSGFICFCLRAAGFQIPDISSRNLAEIFKSKRVERNAATAGCIFFYGKQPVHHVMACLTRWPDGHVILIGARGGNEKTTDCEIAYRSGSMVDVVTSDYWLSEFSFAADPFK